MFCSMFFPEKIDVEKGVVYVKIFGELKEYKLQYGMYIEQMSNSEILKEDFKVLVVGENQEQAIGILFMNNQKQKINSLKSV